MELLALIAEKYGFREVRWLREPDVMMTIIGKRKLSYWRERDLLEYHLNFRDRLFSSEGILCNRMIRTLNQEPFIPLPQGFLTVHDLVENEYALEQSPEMEGYLLSCLIRAGSEEYSQTVFPYRQTIKSLSAIKTLYPESYFLLIQLIPDIKKRLCYHKNLLELPVPFSTSAIKEVMGQLYFESPDESPVSVCGQLQHQIYLWYKQKSESDFIRCFNVLLSGVEEELKYPLIQTIVAPWEWWECVQSLQNKQDNVNQVMEAFVEKWEAMKEITCLAHLSILERRISVHE